MPQGVGDAAGERGGVGESEGLVAVPSAVREGDGEDVGDGNAGFGVARVGPAWQTCFMRSQWSAQEEAASVLQATFPLRRIVGHPCFGWGGVLVLFFILPRFGGIAVMVGCAVLLSAFVWAQPERFRSRSGSMRLASGLVIGMWVAAAVVAALALAGGAQG